MRKLYIRFLFWAGLAGDYGSKKRLDYWRELGHNPHDNTDLNELLKMASKPFEEKK
jgi:hypothetical protein